MAAAALRQAFLQADQEGARQVWRRLADQLRPRWPSERRMQGFRSAGGLPRFTSVFSAVRNRHRQVDAGEG